MFRFQVQEKFQRQRILRHFYHFMRKTRISLIRRTTEESTILKSLRANSLSTAKQIVHASIYEGSTESECIKSLPSFALASLVATGAVFVCGPVTGDASEAAAACSSFKNGRSSTEKDTTEDGICFGFFVFVVHLQPRETQKSA